uniref:Dead/deah box helicase domain-containing protein n=1 Tax=uncultured marine group II/III euryarchaeote KM3_192_C12 TaxID=1457964 RepID=A0A075GU49_9EURY|nr:dead/deah box helicase domain-containing protein [uncultured marine group II/III euryarchaeote KM3_192_C12]
MRAEPYLPTSLILTPTRELAEQICSVLTPLAHEMDLDVVAVYGGTSYSKQTRPLKRGVDVVVACPGRLLDLLDNNALSLENVDIVVIDEADRMADMGFMEPVCKILDNCSPERQTILYSATLDDEVADLVKNYQHEPVTIEVGPKEVSMENMNHIFWLMKNSMKSEIASEAIRKNGRSIVFCRTRRGVDRVGYDLEDTGLSVATLHGGLTQRQRDGAMARFSKGNCIALVATDVAARGIDVEGVQTVIHYDPPENGKAYKHRSGRTARAGAVGNVISLVQGPQKKAFSRMQREVGINCKFTPPDFSDLPETDFVYTAESRPRRNRRQESRNGGYNNRGRSQNRSRGRSNGRNGRNGRSNGQGRGARHGGRGGYGGGNRGDRGEGNQSRDGRNHDGHYGKRSHGGQSGDGRSNGPSYGRSNGRSNGGNGRSHGHGNQNSRDNNSRGKGGRKGRNNGGSKGWSNSGKKSNPYTDKRKGRGSGQSKGQGRPSQSSRGNSQRYKYSKKKKNYSRD